MFKPLNVLNKASSNLVNLNFFENLDNFKFDPCVLKTSNCSFSCLRFLCKLIYLIFHKHYLI